MPKPTHGYPRGALNTLSLSKLKIDKLPSVQRETGNPIVGDDFTEFRAGRAQQRRRFFNCHQFGSVTDFQHEVHPFGSANLENDAFANLRLEVRQFRFYRILPDGSEGAT